MKNELEKNEQEPVWMTTEEVAIYLRLSKRVIYNLTSNGYLPYYKIKDRNRFLKSEIDNLMKSNKVGA